MRRAAVLGALSIGPLAAYLVWALIGRHWGHLAVAATLNLTLWTLGPALIAYAARGVH